MRGSAVLPFYHLQDQDDEQEEGWKPFQFIPPFIRLENYRPLAFEDLLRYPFIVAANV